MSDVPAETTGEVRRRADSRDADAQGGGRHVCRLCRGRGQVLAQAITTDTTGIQAGDFEVKIGDYMMPVYEARPASGGPTPIVVCISEVWACTNGCVTYPPFRQGGLLRRGPGAVQTRRGYRPRSRTSRTS